MSLLYGTQFMYTYVTCGATERATHNTLWSFLYECTVLSRGWGLKTGFRLAIGFINHLCQAVKAYRSVRDRGYHIFLTIGSQMAVRLSALRGGRHLPPGTFLVLISVRGWVDRKVIVRLEGLGQLKKSTSSGLEPATFRLVAQCLNQLRYPVPIY
jgi:hypothetical protein